MDQGQKIFPTGYLEYLPEMYAASRPGSSISTVFEAVALANLSRRYHGPSDVSAMAAAKYGSALRLTSEALKDPKQMLSHEAVLSCHLLGMYEVREVFGGR